MTLDEDALCAQSIATAMFMHPAGCTLGERALLPLRSDWQSQRHDDRAGSSRVRRRLRSLSAPEIVRGARRRLFSILREPLRSRIARPPRSAHLQETLKRAPNEWNRLKSYLYEQVCANFPAKLIRVIVRTSSRQNQNRNQRGTRAQNDRGLCAGVLIWITAAGRWREVRRLAF